MKKRKIIIIIITTSIIIILSNLFKIKINNNVYVECIYEMYACGDCYPRYKVLSSNVKNIENKDIYILAKINNEYTDLVELLDNQICVQCYLFKVKGKLFYSVYRKQYTLEAEEYILENNVGCCKDEKKEIEKLRKEQKRNH